MKRYIRSTQYTMDYDDKLQVMKWLDSAESKIWKFCRDHSDGDVFYEIDDVSWGTDCFNIPVFKGDRISPNNYRKVSEFRFCYDPDDVFERSVESQVEQETNDFIYDLAYMIGDEDYEI